MIVRIGRAVSAAGNLVDVKKNPLTVSLPLSLTYKY